MELRISTHESGSFIRLDLMHVKSLHFESLFFPPDSAYIFPSPSGPWSLMVLCQAAVSHPVPITTSRLQRGKRDPGSCWAPCQALATLPWLTLQMTDDH